MNKLITLTAVCFLAFGAYGATPAERLDESLTQAKTLADKQAYGEAAAVLEGINKDVTLTAQAAWPDTIYTLARYQARAGQKDKALASLKYAVELGVTPSSADVGKEADFTALREAPEFQAILTHLEKEAAIWKDNPALATPFKPVLSEEEKVAGLSKMWSEARFNFPFFGRIPDLDWDKLYMQALAEARTAKTTEDYYGVLTRFVAQLKDGHTRIIAPPELQDRFYGVAPVQTKLVQGQIVVTGVDDPALTAQGIGPGSAVVTINGLPALDYAKRQREPYISGVTPQEREAWIYDIELLRGPVDEPVNVTFKLASGKLVPATMARKKNEGFFGFFPGKMGLGQFKMLPDGIAYLQIGDFISDIGIKIFRENYDAIAKSKGLVIDIRHNPGGDDRNAMAILKVLTDKPFMGSMWRSRDYKAAIRSWNRQQGWFRGGPGSIQPDGTMHYTGAVAVLTDGRTYSSAEDFTVAFTTMKRGTQVGEPTGGGTGNPLVIKLPGGGLGLICTKDDYFPDGRFFEGVGIKPQVAVSPTIKDIRAGRDAVLAKAVEVLKKAR